jgi:hypothetical protein
MPTTGTVNRRSAASGSPRRRVDGAVERRRRRLLQASAPPSPAPSFRRANEFDHDDVVVVGASMSERHVGVVFVRVLPSVATVAPRPGRSYVVTCIEPPIASTTGCQPERAW